MLMVALVVREGASSVVAVCEGLAAAGVGERGNDNLLLAGLEATRIIDVYGGRTAEAVPLGHGPWPQDRLQLRPVHQILADRVSPVRVAPYQAEGVRLPEEVILAIVVHHAVRIVAPAALLAEAQLWPEDLVVQRLEIPDRVRHLQRLHAVRAGDHLVDADRRRLAPVLGEVDKGPPVRLLLGQENVEDVYLLGVDFDRHPPARGLVPDRQQQVLPLYLHLPDQLPGGKRLPGLSL